MMAHNYWRPEDDEQRVVKYLGEGAYGEVVLIDCETLGFFFFF